MKKMMQLRFLLPWRQRSPSAAFAASSAAQFSTRPSHTPPPPSIVPAVCIPLARFSVRDFGSESAAILNGQPSVNANATSDKAGPLFQYQRRVASGDLMAGDKFQEHALRALQALYDELVDTAAATGIDDLSPSTSGRASKEDN